MAANLSTFNFKELVAYLRIVIFVSLLTAIMIYIGDRFEEISGKNQNLTYAQRAFNTFYTEKNDIDLVFIGSSHSYCTFDPEFFDENSSFYSYQMGTPLQHPDTSYYALREILEYQVPKIVVLEVYWDMLDDSFELKQADVFLNAIRNENIKNEYIKEVFPLEEKVKYFFKPIRYQQDVLAYYNKLLVDFVNKYKVDNSNENKVSYVEYYRDRGFLYTEKVMPEDEYYKTNQFVGFNGENWVFDEKQKNYIEKVNQLCNENNIKLLFVTAPIANVSLSYIENYEMINKQISAFAAELNVDYLDYNMLNSEEKLLSNEDFQDDAHLNYNGTQVVQKHFLRWLLER